MKLLFVLFETSNTREEKKETHERIKYIDVAKGIAAILVVVGHSIQVQNSLFDNNVIFRLIYSFHMPLFMFLSGYVTYRKIEIDYHWLFGKIKKLAIPFVLWTVMPEIFSGNGGNAWNKLAYAIQKPDSSFWFLLILFYNNVLVYLITKFARLFQKVANSLKNKTIFLCGDNCVMCVWGGYCLQ